MNHTNLDYVKQLTALDKKSLMGKALKIAEEVGELSGKVLPFENASGTLHRFVASKDILEEVADVILCALSVAYDIGFDHGDIEEMMVQKSHKWAMLQKAESLMADKLPYEIHITVAEAEQDKFIAICKQLEVKPIVLALQKEQSFIKDVMTSSVFMGTNKGAFDEMKRISKGLTDAGFEVVREKIETVPWHSAAPSEEFNKPDMPKDCYFESHLGIKMTSDSNESKLKKFCELNRLHLSQNAFKKHNDGSYTIMATYRMYEGSREDFEQNVEQAKNSLVRLGFQVDKVITEFSIYDSKVSHDAEWLNQ